MITIKHKLSLAPLYIGEGESIKQVLQKAVSERADLQGAYLQGADLQGAYLQGAYLRRAYLQGADLRRADLRGAYLRWADLRGADLQGADLQGAYLQGADLQGADLRGAYLRGADLRGADLQGADLQGAYLQGAYLRGAKDIPTLEIAKQKICPEGTITGWKKLANGILLRVEIPADARRVNALDSRKCRAEWVIPREIFGEGSLVSRHDPSFTYVLGEVCKPTNGFNDSVHEECAAGIHFFITREEAEAYE
jgi:hypothetical protein